MSEFGIFCGAFLAALTLELDENVFSNTPCAPCKIPLRKNSDAIFVWTIAPLPQLLTRE
jgi:hypothetical protein